MISTHIDKHAERNVIRLEVRQNPVLRTALDEHWNELANHLVIVDAGKGDLLLQQGVHEMEQYFVLSGTLKRVVTNAEAKEMILRFASAKDMETSYAAWRMNTPTPYSIVCISKVRVAKLPMPVWVDFIGRHPAIKDTFEYEVMRLMSEVMAHTITLHLLDAPGRVHRFERKHPDLAELIPKKELAAYLNLSAETLSRLKQRGKI